MIPKEKASELVDKMLSKNPNRQDGISSIDFLQAKLCALITVDEIINETLELDRLRYWKEVKNEIKKTN